MDWADTRIARRFFSKLQNGGKCLMNWASFSYCGKSPLYFVDGSMGSVQYCAILQTNLLPSPSKKHGIHWKTSMIMLDVKLKVTENSTYLILMWMLYDDLTQNGLKLY